MSYKVSKENGEAILKIIRRCDGITRDDLMERSGLDADAFKLAMCYVSPYVIRVSGEYSMNPLKDVEAGNRAPARTMPISNEAYVQPPSYQRNDGLKHLKSVGVRC